MSVPRGMFWGVRRNLDLVECALNPGADVHCEKDEALHYVLYLKNIAMARIFFSKGADATARDGVS